MSLPHRELSGARGGSDRQLTPQPPRKRTAVGRHAGVTGAGGLEEESEPPIRRPHIQQVDARSPDRIKLSEELAILNRPLETETEYYDAVPRSRAKPVLAVVMVLAAFGGAGYLWHAQRHRADDNATTAGTAVVPVKAPATKPAPTPAPVAATAAGAAPEAEDSTSGVSEEPEPEGDPTPPARRHAKRPRLP